MTSTHLPFFAFEYFLDCLNDHDVGSLNNSIGLWMVYRCKGDLHPNLVTKIFEHCTIEILGIIDGDLLRDSVTTDDVLLEFFWMVVEVMLVTGFASTHLMKYSTAAIAKV
jgi:hypothetical protein